MARGLWAEDLIELRRAKFDYERSYAANSRVDVTAQSVALVEAYEDLRAAYIPQLGVTSEDRQARLEENFKQRWEDITGFSPDDVDSLVEWESQLRQHLEQSTMAQDKEKQELEEKLAEFNKQVDYIKQKRLNQNKRPKR